ncbi:MAG: hypothetical protein WCD11_14645 [Solirubrobacteraceae bacterium]
MAATVAGIGGRARANPRGVAAARQPGLRRYRDVTGWRVLYPASYYVEVSEQELGLSIVEVTIANFRPRPGIIEDAYPGGGNVRAVPPLREGGRFPADGIALRVVSDQAAPALCHSGPSRPLSLASLRPSRASPASLLYNATTGETLHAGRYHGAPRSLARAICVNGAESTVVVWIGPRATAAQRHALARMIESLTFPKPARSV